MKRFLGVLLALTLLLSAVLTGGCKQRMVTVKTGEIVICTAGEIIEDNTKDVKVPERDVAKYSVTTRITTCPDHGDIALLYNAAQAAIAAGDLKAAAEKLRELLALNPTYKNAGSQLADIEAGKTPKPDGSSPGGGNATDTPNPDDTTDAVSNLVKYVPDAISGYAAQGIIADPASITRNYLPTSGSADQLVIMAEQTVDAKSAAAVIAVLKTVYPGSSASVKIGGKTGYFGVRDAFAFVVVADGPIVVSVELHAKSGKASSLKAEALKVASAIVK
jgi:hypothetical protein